MNRVDVPGRERGQASGCDLTHWGYSGVKGDRKQGDRCSEVTDGMLPPNEVDGRGVTQQGRSCGNTRETAKREECKECVPSFPLAWVTGTLNVHFICV